jgi:iron(III) transport system substrate-binding protein
VWIKIASVVSISDGDRRHLAQICAMRKVKDVNHSTHGWPLRRMMPTGLLLGTLVLMACAPASTPSPTAAPSKPAEAKPTAAAPAAPAKPAADAKPTAAAPAKPAADAKPATAASPVAPAKPAVAQPAAKIDYKAELDKLYEEAKKEGGTLSLYSSMNLDDAKVVLPQFEQAFPGIKVDHVRATGEVLQQRLITETKGGKVLADVLDTNVGQVVPIIQEGLLEPYVVPTAQDIPSQFRDERGLWTTERVTTVMIAWNTSQVKPDEAPQTFEDLADPKWKGKMIMEAADQEMFITLLKQKWPNEEQGLEVFRKIGANEPQVFEGHTQLADFLAAGQGAVCMGCYGHHIVALAQKGAPVEFAKKEGVLNSIAFGLLKGAPHPNTAKLYMSWTMAPDGQRVLGAAGRAPARPGVPISTPLMPEGIKWYPSRPDNLTEYNKYDRLWREIFKIRQ